MARAKVNGKKGEKEFNPCYYNHCHHGDPTPHKTKPWTIAKKQLTKQQHDFLDECVEFLKNKFKDQ